MSSEQATILVVDDEAIVLAVATTILERAGFRVLKAGDAKDALALCRAHPEPIHVALLDVLMPRVTGPELRECLRNDFPGIQVIYMSGYNYEELAIHGISANVTDFIHKPFTAPTLVEKINTALAIADQRV